MTPFEKQRKIEQLAEDDSVYTAWKQIFLEYEDGFAAYVARQPEEIRDILWGYAAGGRMMNQRLLNLACEYMEFPNAP